MLAFLASLYILLYYTKLKKSYSLDNRRTHINKYFYLFNWYVDFKIANPVFVLNILLITFWTFNKL